MPARSHWSPQAATVSVPESGQDFHVPIMRATTVRSVRVPHNVPMMAADMRTPRSARRPPKSGPRRAVRSAVVRSAIPHTPNEPTHRNGRPRNHRSGRMSPTSTAATMPIAAATTSCPSEARRASCAVSAKMLAPSSSRGSGSWWLTCVSCFESTDLCAAPRESTRQAPRRSRRNIRPAPATPEPARDRKTVPAPPPSGRRAVRARSLP